MTTNISMPALSPTMTEGSLTKWFIKVGDKVKAGDVIAEIETDKATMEVEAVDEGIVTKLLFNEGDESIKVNSTIAILDGANNKEDVDKDISESKEDQKPIIKNALENNINNKDKIKNSTIKKNSFNEKFLSPYVRNIAKIQSINLNNITGSGPNGRIIKRDIENYNLKNNSETEGSNISLMRKIIAEKTTKTKQTVPHFYLTIESNVDSLLQFRKKINTTSNFKISINDILVKALALAQRNNPKTNVSWNDGEIIKFNSVDVSIAVALDEGLLTPVIKNADKKGLNEISSEIVELVSKAKEGKLMPEEYDGGTISLSNLGMYGISEFSAIINSPQSSILAVGSIKKIPYVIDDKIQQINVLKSTLSADHRVLDGAIAAKLLKDFNDIVENPFNIWLDAKDMEII